MQMSQMTVMHNRWLGRTLQVRRPRSARSIRSSLRLILGQGCSSIRKSLSCAIRLSNMKIRRQCQNPSERRACTDQTNRRQTSETIEILYLNHLVNSPYSIMPETSGKARATSTNWSRILRKAKRNNKKSNTSVHRSTGQKSMITIKVRLQRRINHCYPRNHAYSTWHQVSPSGQTKLTRSRMSS